MSFGSDELRGAGDEFDPSPRLAALVGQVVVLDLISSYVCLGRLVGGDAVFLELADADLHDFRDSKASREVYVYDSLRFGIRTNRKRVLVRRSEVIAVARLADISEGEVDDRGR